MRTLAAILVEPNRIVVEELDIPSLQAGQVLVDIQYSGVCHTQLLEFRGHRGIDPYLPHCLGHEGSGTVLETGPGVQKVKVGDRVILSWMKGSGANVAGTVYDWKGKKVNAGAITTFQKYAVISENRLIPISSHIPLKEAALMGCMIPTGFGAVLNTLNPSVGQSIAIFGCGGIGLAALMGAKLAGCLPRIAVDVNLDKLQIAEQLGATHLILSGREDPVASIQKIGPLDYAVEATGLVSVMHQAIQAVRPQGGSCVIIGNAKEGEALFLNPKELNQGKRILGTWGGDNQPDIHFPRYCKFIGNESLNFNSFTNQMYSLETIHLAFTDLEQGKAVRPLIEMGSPATINSLERALHESSLK